MNLLRRVVGPQPIFALAVFALAVFALMNFAACGTEVPSTAGTCSVDGDCPSGQGCQAQACVEILRDCVANPCDVNACQTATCDRFLGCSTTPTSTGEPCGKDGCANACDSAGACVARSTPITCGGSGPCSVSACDPVTAKCVTTQRSKGASCDDGDACTATDVCDGDTCAGDPKDCDDKNPCTKDGCTANSARPSLTTPGMSQTLSMRKTSAGQSARSRRPPELAETDSCVLMAKMP